MEIVPIFVENSEGLHCIHYANETSCEFFRLFELWNDYEYLLDFCKENKDEIFTDFWGVSRLEEFVEAIIDEAFELENMLLDYKENGFNANSVALQSIFRPLSNFEISLPSLQLTKAKVDNHKDFRKPKLRLYALRLSQNTFIMTGGCIKLGHRIDDNKHTIAELKKMEEVRKYLKSKEIVTQDDLIYYYDQL